MAARRAGRSNIDDLHDMVYNSTPEGLQVMKESGVSMDMRDTYGRSPLWRAVFSNDLEKVNVFLAAGGDVNASDVKRTTPLHVAAQEGYLDICQTLLDWSGDVNAQTDDALTPLILAVQESNMEIVAALLSFGCNLDLRDSCGRTALHLAVMSEQEECVDLLLQAGANTSVYDHRGRTPLMAAITNGNIFIVRSLASVCDVDLPSKNSAIQECWPPLSYACLKGDPEIVEVLLDAGAAPDPQTEGRLQCISPLCLAVRVKNFEITRSLLEANCSVDWHKQRNHFDRTHRSPLQFAIEHKRLEFAKLLITAGCDVRKETFWAEDRLPLHVKRNTDFLSWVNSQYQNPPSLQSIARHAIRRHLGTNIKKKLQVLKMPKRLFTFILLHDDFDELSKEK